MYIYIHIYFHISHKYSIIQHSFQLTDVFKIHHLGHAGDGSNAVTHTKLNQMIRFYMSYIGAHKLHHY